MAESSKRPVTNAELYSAVQKLTEKVDKFTSADGYGGRLLLAEEKLKENCGDIEKLDRAINGNNGSIGIKAELQAVRHDVKTTLAIVRFILSPVVVILVGVIANLIFGK